MEDSDLRFLLASWDGDAVEGSEYIEHLYRAHVRHLAAQQAAAQALFSLYVLGLLGGGFYLLGARTLALASREGEKAARFVRQLPVHCLSQSEVRSLALLFERPGGNLDGDGEEEEAVGRATGEGGMMAGEMAGGSSVEDVVANPGDLGSNNGQSTTLV
jgi:hypothetical protein